MRQLAKDIGRKREEFEAEMPPPPETIRMRWLELLERLTVDWRSPIEMRPVERRFRRNIIRWIMGQDGARRSLPAGYVLHAWIDDRTPDAIIVMRTR